mmetsp:Transcript_3499/g.9037  ORF Transcript_3499/g.9037 Transcript_3499/m.9037 type:complete len:138 (-) Transcript_3499:72-485(-)
MLYTDSVLLMVPPTIESWAMEGSLRPWVHYVPLAVDYEDLAEKLAWCQANLQRAAEIARAARAHLLYIFNGDPMSEARVVSAVLDGFQHAVQYRFGTENAPAHALSHTQLAMPFREAERLARMEAENVSRAFPLLPR